MLEFFSQVSTFFTTILDFLTMLVDGLFRFFRMIPAYSTFILTSAIELPGIIVPFVILGVTLSILLMVIGRN